MVKNLSHPRVTDFSVRGFKDPLCKVSISDLLRVMNPCWRQIYRAGLTSGLSPVCLFLQPSGVVDSLKLSLQLRKAVVQDKVLCE